MDLAKLKKLEAAATPGPWRSSEPPEGGYPYIQSQHVRHPNNRGQWADVGRCAANNYDNEVNAEFIVEMRNVTPALISAIEHALGCFHAAEAEGWSAAIRDGDIDRIRDLWARRVTFAVHYLEGVIK